MDKVAERGFLVYQHEARALQEGRQTQFRRIIKPQPEGSALIPDSWSWENTGRGSLKYIGNMSIDDISESLTPHCPYGQAGDRLWVRETFCHKADPITAVVSFTELWYRASNPEIIKVDGDGGQEFTKAGYEASPWMPSVHMPRWASRTTLEITEIRAEQVQEISGVDAEAEGFRGHRVHVTQGIGVDPSIGAMLWRSARVQFKAVWDSIHGEGAWLRNEYVWVLSTKEIQNG